MTVIKQLFLSAGMALLPVALAQAAPGVAGKPLRVVIDPGHGGADYGTVYQDRTGRVAEKDITLRIAIRVARHLKSMGISTVLTRSQDVEVSLQQRTALANRVQADVFLSIHMNSTPQPDAPEAEGVETFILNNTTDESSKRLAHFENMVLGPSSEMPKELAENTDVALILKDLRLDANLSESKRLACGIQETLVRATSRLSLAPTAKKAGVVVRPRDRGVKQALFYVLLGADMPSALLEAGFLNNTRDRRIVTSPEGRELMGAAIARAIAQHLKLRGTPAATTSLGRCKVI
ncbi:MAG: hypothetical protein A2X94_07560 [Bdellovibrionales bacterium GWB1_55_8]|nr:MAG: hypothetical protein A2X94_07560 [Bdellovibrionales bacterium GWB1_55_8]